MDLKDIHIGKAIKQLWIEKEIPLHRVCNFLNCDETEINEMLEKKSIETEQLLRWSKLLEYDFFRIYSQHLILFAPPSSIEYKRKKDEGIAVNSELPVFRKSVYTKEIIDYILELIDSKEKTPMQIINEYKIPKTTLYKWIQKYRRTST